MEWNPGKLARFFKDPRYRNRVIHDIEMRKGRASLISRPVYLQVEPTNRCNLNCVMCARPYYDKGKNVLGDMSVETFNKIVPLIKTAEYVALIGYGEPLIARNFQYFLETCRDLGTATSIHTNGVKLDRETSVRLIEGGLGNLTVSLDAAREETFKALRGFSLRKIVENVRGLRKLRDDMGRANPALQINYVLMKDNLPELPDMVDLAADMGATTLGVTHMMEYSRKLVGQSVLHDPSGAGPVFAEAEKRAREKGVLLSLPNLEPVPAVCFQPFEMLFVNWDGKVRPCCSAAFVSEKFSFPIGDLSAEGLLDIWNNETMVGIRKGLLGKGPVAPQCAGCGLRTRDLQGYKRYLD